MTDRFPDSWSAVLIRSLLAVAATGGLARLGWLPEWLLAALLLAAWLGALRPLAPAAPPRTEALPSDGRWGALLALAGVVLAGEAAQSLVTVSPGLAGWLLLFWSWTLLSAAGLLLLAGVRYLRVFPGIPNR